MNDNDKSFRLDRQARSFRIRNFALRDLPLLALAFVLLTLLSLGAGWFLGLLPENGRWICLGLAVGFYLGFVFRGWKKGFPAAAKDSR